MSIISAAFALLWRTAWDIIVRRAPALDDVGVRFIGHLCDYQIYRILRIPHAFHACRERIKRDLADFKERFQERRRSQLAQLGRRGRSCGFRRTS